MMIEYIGAAFDGSGYGEAARGYIGALTDVGEDVRLRFVSFEQVRPDLGELGGWLASRMIKPEDDQAGKWSPQIRVLHTTPDTWRGLVRGLPAVPTVGYCAWETDAPPALWVQEINALVSMLLVPSRQNEEAFRAAGVTVPIYRLAHAVRDVPNRREATLPRDDRFRFLSIFQWTERKNPLGLLKAYLTGFRADEPVSLVLKTYLQENAHEDRKQVIAWINEVKAGLMLREYPRVEVVVAQLSSADLRQLIHDSDVYVSLHRQEGFGLPLAEAMAAGKPVIATRYGGPAEWGLPIYCSIGYQLTPVFGMPWANYTGAQKWAEPNLIQARELMREMYLDTKLRSTLGEQCRAAALRDFAPEVVGQEMVRLLREAVWHGAA